MRPRQPITLINVVDSELYELIAMNGMSFESEAARLYAGIMEAFLGGDPRRLKELVNGVAEPQGPESAPIQYCGTLRLRILESSLDPDFFAEMERRLPGDALWRGEGCALLGYAADLLGQNGLCRDYNRKAQHLFATAGAKRKAVRMRANALAAEARLDPSRHYIPDLLNLLRDARRVRDYSTSSTASMHLSREYQLLRAWDVALGYAIKAVAFGSKNGGSLAYYYALTQRCHVLAQMGRLPQARTDYQLALTAKFPIIHGALRVLSQEFPALLFLPDDQVGLPKGPQGDDSMFWERRIGESTAGSLSKTEQKLLKFLSEEPRTKEEMSVHLYGDKISPESAKIRLFTLLSRLRKRYPKLVQLTHGKYSLAEDATLEKEKTAV